jgi:hypothetical protein
MSMLDQLDAYESPHKLPMYPMSGGNLDAHHRWYQAREYYATIGAQGEMDQEDIEEARAYWYDQMLKAVSETNPPVNRIDLNASPAVAPEQPKASRSTSAMALVFITLYMLVLATWISAVMWVIT